MVMFEEEANVFEDELFEGYHHVVPVSVPGKHMKILQHLANIHTDGDVGAFLLRLFLIEIDPEEKEKLEEEA